MIQRKVLSLFCPYGGTIYKWHFKPDSCFKDDEQNEWACLLLAWSLFFSFIHYPHKLQSIICFSRIDQTCARLFSSQVIRFTAESISLFVLPDLTMAKHITKREMLIQRDFYSCCFRRTAWTSVCVEYSETHLRKTGDSRLQR